LRPVVFVSLKGLLTQLLTYLRSPLSSLLGSQTTPHDVMSTQWVVIVCAEPYNETVRGVETDHGAAGSAESYAQSLMPDIAEVASVNKSRLIDVLARENPSNGVSISSWSLSFCL